MTQNEYNNFNQSSVDSLCLSLVSSHFVTIFMSVVCHGLTLSRFFFCLTLSQSHFVTIFCLTLSQSHFVTILFCPFFVTITYTWSVTVSLCHGFLSMVCHCLILSRYFLSMICHGLTLSQFFVRGLSQSHFVSLVTQFKKIIRAILRGFIVRGRAPRTRQNFIVTCVSAVCHDYDKHRTWYF